MIFDLFNNQLKYKTTCHLLHIHVHSLIPTSLPDSIQQQQVHSMNTELENYKKSIVKEQEHNEQLTLLLRKIETDINHIKRLIDQCEVKSEALKVDYMTYTRALQETEQALTVVTGVSREYYYHNYVICMYYHIW